MIRVSKKRIILFVVVIGLLLFLHLIGTLSFLENSLIRLVNPLVSDIHQGASVVRSEYYDKTDKSNLLQKVEELKQQVNELTVKNSQLLEVETENEQLRRYLNFSDEHVTSYILANIISKESFLDSPSLEQNIIINQGSINGLSEGLAVVDESGIVIGKIIETKDYISRMCFITSSNCKLAVGIQNQDKTIGVSEGDLGLTVKINFVSQADRVSTGDIVITSGLEQNIPRGLVMGKVSQATNKSNDVWQTVTVEPLVDFNDLNIVSVILN